MDCQIVDRDQGRPLFRRQAKSQLQAKDIEEKTGRKPGKKEQREMREDILHSLLP